MSILYQPVDFETRTGDKTMRIIQATTEKIGDNTTWTTTLVVMLCVGGVLQRTTFVGEGKTREGSRGIVRGHLDEYIAIQSAPAPRF